jgi:HSP90 family molecular chaperone
MALRSPYLEVFDKAGREVIFVYNAIDDFVMANLVESMKVAIWSVRKRPILSYHWKMNRRPSRPRHCPIPR